MKLQKREPQPVVIEFTRDEAARLADSLFGDFTWTDTSEEALYTELHSLLLDGVEEW